MIQAEFISFISQFLPQSRIEHSLRVAHCARDLAKHHGVDQAHAEIAGILHDVAKMLSPDKCKEKNLTTRPETNQVWDQFALVWHQYAGADIVAGAFPSLSDTILAAIRWHTTGTADMAPLTQVVFLADYFEPQRPFETRPLIEKLAYSNLDQATYALARLSLTELINRQIPIFPESIQCHNFYLSKIAKKDAKVIGHLLHPYL